jgi:hypothetical protein
MAKSIVSNIRKKIGRPRVDATPILVRIPPDELAAIDGWVKAKSVPKPSRPEAIRRLVEIGLKAHVPESKAVERLRKRVAGATKLAVKGIDGLTVSAGDADEKASRTRRLNKAKGK